MHYRQQAKRIEHLGWSVSGVVLLVGCALPITDVTAGLLCVIVALAILVATTVAAAAMRERAAQVDHAMDILARTGQVVPPFRLIDTPGPALIDREKRGWT